VSALRSVFANRDISVSFRPILREHSPSTSSITEIAVVESEDHIADADPDTDSSENITPILYVGPSSLGLINLLLTNPTTPVRNRLCSFFTLESVDTTFSLFPQGPWL
jgi:hypothetical protein